MSEFIVIQVGQCGNQIGSCLLPKILQEYGLNNETSKPKKAQTNFGSFFHYNENKTNLETLSELVKAKTKVRFLCIDMEDSVVARVKIGKFKDLYDRKCLITHYPGSGNNWAEGHCSHGPKFQQKILKTLQYMTEQCNKLHGFLLLFSMGGGTGSGLGTFVVKLLDEFYPKIEKFVVCVYPIGTEDVITCPYNMAFATRELLDYASCVFPVENRALLKISKRSYSNVLPYGPFEDLNMIIVDMLLHLTSGARFGGKFNVDMSDISTNMVPFPRLNYLGSSFSPIVLKSTKNHLSKKELFIRCCSRSNQMISLDSFNCRFTTMSVMLLGRGSYTQNDMRDYAGKLRSKLKFAPWSSKALRIGLCDVSPKDLDYSMFCLNNTTGIANLFGEIKNQFAKLYQRKAHIHHYTAISEFDIGHFDDCYNCLTDIIQMYKDVERK